MIKTRLLKNTENFLAKNITVKIFCQRSGKLKLRIKNTARSSAPCGKKFFGQSVNPRGTLFREEHIVNLPIVARLAIDDVINRVHVQICVIDAPQFGNLEVAVH